MLFKGRKHSPTKLYCLRIYFKDPVLMPDLRVQFLLKSIFYIIPHFVRCHSLDLECPKPFPKDRLQRRQALYLINCFHFYFFPCDPQVRAGCHCSWPQIHNVAKNNLELLILLLPPPDSQDYKFVPLLLVYVVVGIEP